MLYDKELLVDYSEEKIPLKALINNKESSKESFEEHPQYYYLPFINIDNYNKFKNYFYTMDNSKLSVSITNSVLSNALKEVNRDYLLLDVFVNSQQLQDKDKLRRIQREVFESLKITYHSKLQFNQEIKSFLQMIYYNFKQDFKRQITKEFKDVFSETDEQPNIELKETLLGRLIFTEKFYSGVGSDFVDKYEPRDPISFYLNATLFEHVYAKMFIQLSQFGRVEYIPANRGSQTRVLSVDTNEETFNSSVTYYEHQKNKSISFMERLFLSATQTKSPNEFLENLLSIIGINGEISTEVFEDSVIAVYIEQDGRKINLADYGFGYSQLIPIILKIYNLRRQNFFDRILIIEEPEANLHPNLQSKLADILKFVIEKNKRWKLVVETHSEYLIRKLQYLVADSQLKTEDCIIHYFNSDENLSDQEPKVKSIEITENGNMTDNFGPGFYDEATLLKFELLKLNKMQTN